MGGPSRVEEVCEVVRGLSMAPSNDWLDSYKQGGGRIIGTLYNQVPEEVVLAAGMLPVRLRAQGSTGTEASDARFTMVNCSLVKHFYDSAAKGRFGFIDGLAATNACDHIRKLWENWTDVLKPGYSHLICFPKRRGDELEAAHLAGEYRKFAASLEEAFGVRVTNESLKAAVEACNEKRALLMRLHALRGAEVPPISGSQMLAVGIAATCTPPDRFVPLLKELVEACEASVAESAAAGAPAGSAEPACPGCAKGRAARVVLYGGELDSVPFVEAVESQGALVVGDSLGGFGRRQADMQVATEGDPYENLARAYLQGRPAEPRLHGTRADRWAYLESVAEEVRADGYVQVHVPLCDLWSYERLMFDVEAANKGLRCLDLDTEYIFANAGQTRTRVQAFVETLTEGGR